MDEVAEELVAIGASVAANCHPCIAVISHDAFIGLPGVVA